MSRDIQTMTERQRGILQFLLAGWQTMDEAKQTGFVSLNQLAGHFGVSDNDMRQDLDLLETLGYVENVHSFGGDPTVVYKGIEGESLVPFDPADPTYFLAENGKKLLIAETLHHEGDTASPA
jgi:hypothetical protein